MWSTDWWHEPAAEIRRLEEAVEEAAAALRSGSTPQPTPEVPEPEPESPAPGEDEGVGLADESAAGPTPFPVLEPLSASGPDADIYDPRSAPIVGEQLANVVAAAGPVHVDRAVRMVALAWGQTRLSARLKEHVVQSLVTVPANQRPQRRGTFLWQAAQDVETYNGMRPSADGDPDPREAEEIPEVEVANAATYVLQGLVSVPREDLARECARFFGFKRMGTRVQSAMEAGIDRMVARGDAVREGDRVTCVR